MERSQQTLKEAANVRRMFDSIAPRYDLLNTVLSAGVHKKWRKEALSLVTGEIEFALDLCCGTGDLLPLLAERAKSVVGVDFSLEMLKVGRERHSFPLIQGDALALPFRAGSFDLVTVAFGVRNFEDLSQGLDEIHRVLTPGGQVLILEFGQPRSRMFGGIYNFYSSYIMPQIGAALSGNRTAYKYLPKTAREFPCGIEFNSILKKRKFKPLAMKSHFGGIAYSYLGIKN